MMELTFDRVTKFYGPVIGVNDLSCRVGPGITGLLGSNGAGKSTLLKLASGQLRPNFGRVQIGPYRTRSTAAKRYIGYCPDLNAFYEDMTGREFVRAMAALYGYSRHEIHEHTERVLAEVGMSDRAERRLGGCSHGMRQRINIAQALVNDPPVLLLDEPFSGIDPGGRREMNDLLGRLADNGKSILVSSHLLDEIEHLADRVLVIARGRLIASGTLESIRAMLENRPVRIAVEASNTRALAAQLIEWPEVQSIELDGDQLRVSSSSAMTFYESFAVLAADERWGVRRLEPLDLGAGAVFQYLQQGVA
jgi:ABC-2 type transport system ATP-binding protein